jgi:hypothetical protein
VTNPVANERGFFEALLGDGRFLLSLTGIALVISGGFAIGQSVSGQLLPHDVHALGMDASQLLQQTSANLVRFMFHDRVAFGGTLLAIGMAYLVAGRVSVEGRQGLGLVDLGDLRRVWISKLSCVPRIRISRYMARRSNFVFVAGFSGWNVALSETGRAVDSNINLADGLHGPAGCGNGRTQASAALRTGLGRRGCHHPGDRNDIRICAQDVSFIGIPPEKLRTASQVLVPLLAHDRAGFGGGLFSFGLLLLMMMRHAALSRRLVEVVTLMGLCGFGAALGVHFAIGYTDFVHLLPGYGGFLLFAAGAALLARGWFRSRRPIPVVVTAR